MGRCAVMGKGGDRAMIFSEVFDDFPEFLRIVRVNTVEKFGFSPMQL